MDFNVKALIGAIPLTAILTYFHLTGEVVLIYGLVAVTDTLLAIVSQYGMGEQITSEKWTKGVTKKLTRLLLPFLLSGVAHGAGFDQDYVQGAMTALMSLLIVGEGYSALRHIYRINTGKDLPEIDVFTLVVQKIADIFKSKLQAPQDTNTPTTPQV